MSGEGKNEIALAVQSLVEELIDLTKQTHAVAAAVAVVAAVTQPQLNNQRVGMLQGLVVVLSACADSALATAADLQTAWQVHHG